MILKAIMIPNPQAGLITWAAEAPDVALYSAVRVKFVWNFMKYFIIADARNGFGYRFFSQPGRNASD